MHVSRETLHTYCEDLCNSAAHEDSMACTVARFAEVVLLNVHYLNSLKMAV